MSGDINGDLVADIRQRLDHAHRAGEPRPGRPTLVRETGATDHQVRKALHQLRRQHTPTGPGVNEQLAVNDTNRSDRTTIAGEHLIADHASPGEPASPSPAESPGRRRSRQTTSTTRRSRTTPGASPPPPAPAGGRLAAWTGFLFGATASIAANVLHTWLPATHQLPGWTPGIAPQIGAAVWPLALMLAVETLSRVHWPATLTWRLARYGGAGTVATGSAVISYSHVRDVLLAWSYTPLAAAVGPLVLDGLVVICGLALLANTRPGSHWHADHQ